MGLQHLYMQEKLADEHRQELLREVEQRRLVAHLPQRSSLGRHAIACFGAFLVTLGTWLERAEQHEADLASAHSLSGTLH